MRHKPRGPTADASLTISALTALTAQVMTMSKRTYLDIARQALAKVEATPAFLESSADERAAIQWVENGPATEVEAAKCRAVAEWNELTGLTAGRVAPYREIPSPDAPYVTVDPFETPPPARKRRPLIGCGFPPIPPTIPPAAILATPKVICPGCRVRPVLPELRAMTGGRCWDCWTETNSTTFDSPFRS
jgi:hypothetical protein